MKNPQITQITPIDPALIVAQSLRLPSSVFVVNNKSKSHSGRMVTDNGRINRRNLCNLWIQ
jgi:hypothetical protein